MKKYLISIVAATALILAFTGCSKSNDLYNQGIIDEKNKEAKLMPLLLRKLLVPLVQMWTGVSVVRVPVRVLSPVLKV